MKKTFSRSIVRSRGIPGEFQNYTWALCDGSNGRISSDGMETLIDGKKLAKKWDTIRDSRSSRRAARHDIVAMKSRWGSERNKLFVLNPDH